VTKHETRGVFNDSPGSGNRPPSRSHQVHVGAFGLAPDTSNMGVSALCHSFVDTLFRGITGCGLTLFDHGKGCRRGSLLVGGERIPLATCGAIGGARLYRKENLNVARLFAGLGPVGGANTLVRAIDKCDVVMDASAGDSFSDIYGSRRFRNIVLPKKIAALRSRPMLLLPQTYGPFRDKHNAALARDAILSCEQAWARDEDSLGVLKDLLGSDFDPTMHRSGVDMAFGLPAVRPLACQIPGLEDWLGMGPKPLGFNVSGLVWNRGEDLEKKWGFKASYRKLVVEAVSWMLRTGGHRLLLIPHVLSPAGRAESDLQAAHELLAQLDPGVATPDRIRIVSNTLNEQELKWLIGNCSWFCGTRMHSTIAALSSGVPSASIVYSDKAAGVFDRCGQREHVIDPRQFDNEEALSRFITAFEARDQARSSLAGALVGVREVLDAQSESFIEFALKHARR